MASQCSLSRTHQSNPLHNEAAGSRFKTKVFEKRLSSEFKRKQVKRKKCFSEKGVWDVQFCLSGGSDHSEHCARVALEECFTWVFWVSHIPTVICKTIQLVSQLSGLASWPVGRVTYSDLKLH